MGMAMVIIVISSAFLDLGFSRAIIQQKEITAQQYSTVFYINLAIGLLLFLICFSTAGAVADFYKQPAIRDIFRAVSVLFIINALNLVPSALIYRQLKFKEATIINIVSTLLAGTVGLWMAYNNKGVWSLVGQSLTYSVLVLVINVVYTRFIPVLQFSIQSVKSLWNYGSRLFASGLLDVVFTRLDVFLIGKLFTPATLGYYSRAQSMDSFVRQFSSTSIAAVLFPHIARNQDDKAFVKEQYIKNLHLITMVSICLSGVLFLVAVDLFVILFSERWGYAGYLFQLMAIAAFIWPVSNLMCTLIAALGNSKNFLRLEIYKKMVLFPVYIFGFFWGIEVFIVIMMAAYYIALWLNAHFVNKEIEVTDKQQLLIIGQYIFIGVAATAIAYYISNNFIQFENLFAAIALKGSVFLGAFLGLGFLLKLQGIHLFTAFLQQLKNKLNDQRN